jgi:cysteine synthase A
VDDGEAVQGVQALARLESIIAGPASGAVIHAAVALAKRQAYAGKVVVALLPDRAEHYLDHASMSLGA